MRMSSCLLVCVCMKTSSFKGPHPAMEVFILKKLIFNNRTIESIVCSLELKRSFDPIEDGTIGT